jgi:hypothetical protein
VSSLESGAMLSKSYFVGFLKTGVSATESVGCVDTAPTAQQVRIGTMMETRISLQYADLEMALTFHGMVLTNGNSTFCVTSSWQHTSTGNGASVLRRIFPPSCG